MHFFKSLVFKTALMIIVIQAIILFFVGLTTQYNQTEVMHFLNKNQENFIINLLEKEKIKDARNELKTLYLLIESIKGTIKDDLYNYDTENAKITLESLLNRNNTIIGISVLDSSSNNIFIQIYKNNNKLSTIPPKNIKNLEKIKVSFYENNEKLGEMEVYYDMSNIYKNLDLEKEKNLKAIENLFATTNEQLKINNEKQDIYFIIGIILVTLSIILILLKFVNTPLKELKNGLLSFFEFLQNPKKSVNSININTKDEFGEMANFVNEGIKVSANLHSEIANLIMLVDKYVIIIENDNNGIITNVSDAFCEISAYTKDEILHKHYNYLNNTNRKFEHIKNEINKNNVWQGEIKIYTKYNKEIWLYVIISKKHNSGYTTIGYDITNKKKVEYLTKNLEQKVEQRTKELEIQKKHLQKIFDNRGVAILVVDTNRKIIEINKRFCEIWGYSEIDIIGKNAEELHISKDTFIQFGRIAFEKAKNGNQVQLEYQMKRKNGTKFWAYFSGEPLSDDGKVLWMISDITQLKDAQKQIEILHKHTQESIEFASLLQTSLLPRKEEIDKCFKDDFLLWQPKDIVGGDIYLFETLRDKNECLLMVIDCTGHGVPGAFVTMIVKAVEREIIRKIKDNNLLNISPSWILEYFNNTIKKLLRQENENSKSNAGFDGGIIYYNKNTKLLKFSGAATSLFYVENNEVKSIKGDRYSVGYKKCEFNHKYTEHIIKVKEGMKFYLTTDGYLDQNGGEKDFPFGKKRFKKLIEKSYLLEMYKQKEIFINTIEKYKIDEQNDDITVIGFEIE